ncbi:hypothetical protein MUK42_30003 [Musa troglodytarum]|uniref:Uncharacterized protein n=1 Tax=Musa troglodytarum TaxID=320322 RepID=A0A9E7JZ14_9LILI|nr:hypothetical protein MUK42_30003 [Musa troglodytarum]
MQLVRDTSLPNTEYQEITIGSGLLHRPFRRLNEEMRSSRTFKVWWRGLIKSRCRTGPSSFFVFVAISQLNQHESTA